MPKKDKELEAAQLAEAQRIEKQRREGAATLNRARADEAAKTDEQRAAEEAEAKAQQEAAAQAEAERVAAEQEAAEKTRIAFEEAAAEQAAAEQAPEDDLNPGSIDEEDFQRFKEHFNLPADTRILKAGSVLLLNGEPCTVPVDVPIVVAGAASEQHYASVLARDPANFALNSDLLRLVYNPMNGSPLPLEGQRLSLDEMNEQERALFEAPTRPKR